jgi:hypothetical protein
MNRNQAAIGLVLLLAAGCGGQPALTAAPTATPGRQPTPTALTATATPQPASPTPAAASTDTALAQPDYAWPLTGDGRPSAGGFELSFEGAYVSSASGTTFDGQTGFATTTAPGPLDTTASFSVAAWVTLGPGDPYPAAISQLGEVSAAFFLGYAEGSWAFSMNGADSNDSGPGIGRAMSAAAARDGTTWVQLVGVYDHAAGRIRLFVDGRLAGEAPFRARWRANGPLTIGRDQAFGGPASFWAGAISDVRIYSVVLHDAEVATIYASSRPTASAPPAPTLSPVGSFRRDRNIICEAATADVIEIIATTVDRPGATPAEIAAGVRQYVDRAEQAQRELDELDVPPTLADFVAADNARRTERIQLMHELATAIEAGDDRKAEEIDPKLTAVNIETEAAEHAHGFLECP